MTFNGSSCPEELSSDVYSGLDGPSQLSGVHAAGESRESSQKRSDMWDHFKKAADYETSKKASCIHCKARLTTYAVVGPPGACGGMSRMRTPKHSASRSLLD